MAIPKSVVFVAIMAGFLPPQETVASSCMKVVTARIKFKQGQSCWHYKGTTTAFTGSFLGSQQISVSMFGLATFSTGNGDDTEKKWEPRSPSVSGPNGFFVMDSDGTGKLNFMTREAGKYTFDFSPCAMWGGYGEVDICAR